MTQSTEIVLLDAESKAGQVLAAAHQRHWQAAESLREHLVDQANPAAMITPEKIWAARLHLEETRAAVAAAAPSLLTARSAAEEKDLTTAQLALRETWWNRGRQDLFRRVIAAWVRTTRPAQPG